ncbi:MAG: tRNA (N6-threonylcarbamoyladenosine(37)-N6)-methyltransferase TrmO [Bacteroidetes bacterium]|nr:MAG: tRNA (N6-threonylcarbamoyladenosine(37)-N6)-methyltransferase TrmO [Bacteroidota bacterium]
MSPNQFIIHPIGIIHTPYKDKYLAPRQPGMASEHVEGTITLFPNRNFEQALDDVAGFERIWLLSWFHKNTEWKPKVLPPRSGRKKRGLFATRSPHRPNPIGISVCKLLGIDGLNIRVENPDLLDGTPIIDIKPYIPYADSFPQSRSGWLETLGTNKPVFTVTISPLANEQARWLETEHGIELLKHVQQTLSLDPMPHSFRRTKRNPDGGYIISLKSWRVRYTINSDVVYVERIESGYSSEELSKAKKSNARLHDEEGHREFHRKWSQ